MALRPPNPSLATDMVSVTRTNDAVGARGGLFEDAGASASFPAIVTKSTTDITRKDDDGAGAPVSVSLWDVMLLTSSDPGVLIDDLLTVTSDGKRKLKALGPSYPRSTGAYKVECQEVR